MTTTNGTPVDEASVELRDATNWAADIVNTAINMDAPTRLSGAALRVWETAQRVLADAPRESAEHRHGVKLSLDALIMQPEALAWVASEARDHLVKVEAAEGLAVSPGPVEAAIQVNQELKHIVLSVQDLLVGAMDGGCHQHLPQLPAHSSAPAWTWPRAALTTSIDSVVALAT